MTSPSTETYAYDDTDKPPVKVDGHWFIDGMYGYGEDQRICRDAKNGRCLGIPDMPDEEHE